MRIVPERSAVTLLPIIQQHVCSGTIVYSDKPPSVGQHGSYCLHSKFVCRTPRCTICWSTFPPVFSFCVFNRFCCKKPPTFENLSPGKRNHYTSITGSRDTSQGRWEWPVAVVWLPAFVARLVRQVQLIRSLLLKIT